MRVGCVLCLLPLLAWGQFVTVEESRWEANRPDGWHVVHRANPQELLQLTIAVKQQRVADLEDVLLRVSDPASESYGKHLSFDEVQALVAPAAESVAAVSRWLGSYGIAMKWHSDNYDFITAEVSVAQAEVLLSTNYQLLEHATARNGNITAVRCASYRVPAGVAPHIDFVAPTVRLPVVRTARVKKSNSAVVGSIDVFNDPKILRALYQVGEARGQASTNVQAVASFLEQYYSPNDLAEFFAIFQNTSVGHTVAQSIGPNKPGDPGTEASLDVEYIMGVGSWVPTWVYYTPGRSPTNPQNEPFLAWLANVTSSSSVPYVISVSYGEDEKSVGLSYAQRINTEFAKLGARGVSIMFASGDSGAGGNCSSSGRLTPNFPAGSPYVTAVGGLVGGTPGNTPTGEVCDSISGGGFSDYWPTPSWQKAAATAYMQQSGLPAKQYWNQSGRGYPDVACQSEDFVVVQFGLPLPGVGGTSCATPTFSGVISLLNDLRLQAGKSSLGFLNPLIYQIAPANVNAFNDVIQGANAGCGHGGFPAKKGWDAATGWGSPNYALLSKIVSSLP